MRPSATVPASLLAAMLVLGAAASVPAAPDAPALAAVHVHLQNFDIVPDTVQVSVGETVSWDNHDAFLHTATAHGGHFDSGDLVGGASFDFTFLQPGTFTYECVYHPGSMQGKVIVSDATALPDLVVASIEASDVLPGVTKRLDVTVRNLGDRGADASKVAVAYRHQGSDHAIAEADVPSLGPGEASVVQVTWTVAGKVGDFLVVATADSGGDVDEEDEGNNTGSAVVAVLLPGVAGVDVLDPL